LPDQRPNREESQTDRGLNQLGIHRWLSFINRAGTWQWPKASAALAACPEFLRRSCGE
jgi:hypothetical protein